MRFCPRCNSDRVRSSRRRGLFERVILRVILIRPYRCRDCENRYYGLAFL